jgi:hypothetical protein
MSKVQDGASATLCTSLPAPLLVPFNTRLGLEDLEKKKNLLPLPEFEPRILQPIQNLN